MKKFVVAGFSLLLYSTSCFAGGGGLTGGALETTQILNNTELGVLNGTQASQLAKQAQQLAHEIEMIQNQLLNLQRYTTDPTQLISTINSLSNLIKQGQVLSYAGLNLDSQFSTLFPGYTTYSGMGNITPTFIRNQFAAWNQQNQDSILATLKAANLQESSILNEESRAATISAMSKNSVGALQVAQAGNLMAAEQTASLLRLRKILMDQSQLHANYYALEGDKEALKKSKWEQMTTPSGTTNTNDGMNWSNIRF